jgi:D-alanyl-D-alanine carboxypeptidase/D-alanyl-D-alanine-endopeptidase (penicillin-binding protein 4)
VSYLPASRVIFGLATLAVFPPALVVGQSSEGDVAARVSAWYDDVARNVPGQWGIAIADQDGRMVWSENPDTQLMPASTVKLLTTGFARSVVGGSARRPTRVVGHGRTDAKTGEWIGTWALELNGDPTLERAEGTGPSLYDLAVQLADAGVRKFSGPLTVRSTEGPATAEYPAVWSRHHYGRLFAPPIGPLTVHENVVWFTVLPGERAGTPGRLVETAPTGISSLVTMQVTTRTGRKSRLVLRNRKDGGWIISGTVGIRSFPQRLTAVAQQPRIVLDAAWASALRRAGITWNRDVAALTAPVREASDMQVLAEVTSATFDSLASEINRRSLNVGAELLLRWATAGQSDGPALLAAHVRSITGQADGVHLVDGSGLSYEDRVTPRTFVNYLAKFPTTAAGRNFSRLLPANGTGTLRHMNAGLSEEGVVRAKTGTLSRASTVVGYLGRSEGVLLMALMYNGPSPWAARQAQWKLFRLLGANGVVIPADTTPPPTYQLGGDSARGD